MWLLTELWFKRYIQKWNLSHVLLQIMTSLIYKPWDDYKYVNFNILRTEQLFYEIKKFFTCVPGGTF